MYPYFILYSIYEFCPENLSIVNVKGKVCDIYVTWQPSRVDWNAHVWTMRTSLYWSVGLVRCHWVSERVYCVAVAFKMTERVEQWICVKFWVKLEHSSMEIIWMIWKAVAMDNWWLAASSQQHARSCITSRAELFCEPSNHPGDSALLQPRFGALWLLALPF